MLTIPVSQNRLAHALFGTELAPVEAESASGWGWAPQLALLAGVALLGSALADAASRGGKEWAYSLFAISLLLFLVPLNARAMWPATPRSERIAIIVIAASALFAVRLIHEPLYFVDHDALLHWSTSLDILEFNRLFRPNPLLPISPVYPGLEIVTTAICNLSGLSVFSAAHVVSFVTRLLFILGLFLLYERVSGSSRIAATGTLVYMGCASFVYFDSMYSYGSLALTFLVLSLLASVDADAEHGRRATLLTIAFILSALALTHHLTGFIAALLFSSLAAMELMRTGWSRITRRYIAIACLVTAFVVGWSWFVGNPSEGYLRPVFGDAFEEAKRLLSFGGGRMPFVSEDGTVMPAWQRYVSLLSVLLVCLGLATGFFRSLAVSGMALARDVQASMSASRFGVRGSVLVLLTLLTLSFPLSIMLRLTRAGWEVGNRISPFAYLGVGVVVAIGVTIYWLGQNPSARRVAVLGCASALCIFAGIVSGGGPGALGTSHYRVSADAASIEPLGISAAQWTQTWLGPNHRFFADRTNRLLLATYGRQQVVTTLYDKVDLEPVVFGSKLGPPELQAVREADLDFLSLDLRLTRQLPVVGWYFDPGRTYDEPPQPASLQKFGTLDGVDRVFDNGFISIADLRKVRDGR